VLAAVKTASGIMLGYHERQSNRIVDIAECPVLVPAIAGKLDAFRALLTKVKLKKKPARLTVLATETGLDVDVANIWPVGNAGPKLRAGLVALCQKNSIARLTLAGELAVQLADPQLMIAGTIVKPQPSAFAQAAAAGETILSGLVSGHLAGCKRVADLFSGFGTFTLSLARSARTHAVEVEPLALAALEDAVRHGQGLKQVTSERRDLLRFPLSTPELKRFDGLVFDPPRSGAKAQAAEIAASPIAKVVAVSCNPATFARDCRILIDGGLTLTRIVPVDQFVYSAETEIVGLFSR
jgi:23S rRNA (uracil1939-C5)-methyltransferase